MPTWLRAPRLNNIKHTYRNSIVAAALLHLMAFMSWSRGLMSFISNMGSLKWATLFFLSTEKWKSYIEMACTIKENKQKTSICIFKTLIFHKKNQVVNDVLLFYSRLIAFLFLPAYVCVKGPYIKSLHSFPTLCHTVCAALPDSTHTRSECLQHVCDCV